MLCQDNLLASHCWLTSGILRRRVQDVGGDHLRPAGRRAVIQDHLWIRTGTFFPAYTRMFHSWTCFEAILGSQRPLNGTRHSSVTRGPGLDNEGAISTHSSHTSLITASLSTRSRLTRHIVWNASRKMGLPPSSSHGLAAASPFDLHTPANTNTPTHACKSV